MIDKYGRTWKQDGDEYVCDGLRIGGLKDPLATMNAMAPEGWQAPQEKAPDFTPDEIAMIQSDTFKSVMAKVQA